MPSKIWANLPLTLTTASEVAWLKSKLFCLSFVFLGAFYLWPIFITSSQMSSLLFFYIPSFFNAFFISKVRPFMCHRVNGAAFDFPMAFGEWRGGKTNGISEMQTHRPWKIAPNKKNITSMALMVAHGKDWRRPNGVQMLLIHLHLLFLLMPCERMRCVDFEWKYFCSIVDFFCSRILFSHLRNHFFPFSKIMLRNYVANNIFFSPQSIEIDFPFIAINPTHTHTRTWLLLTDDKFKHPCCWQWKKSQATATAKNRRWTLSIRSIPFQFIGMRTIIGMIRTQIQYGLYVGPELM